MYERKWNYDNRAHACQNGLILHVLCGGLCKDNDLKTVGIFHRIWFHENGKTILVTDGGNYILNTCMSIHFFIKAWEIYFILIAWIHLFVIYVRWKYKKAIPNRVHTVALCISQQQLTTCTLKVPINTQSCKILLTFHITSVSRSKKGWMRDLFA